jgi:hypothetical protein
MHLPSNGAVFVATFTGSLPSVVSGSSLRVGRGFGASGAVRFTNRFATLFLRCAGIVSAFFEQLSVGFCLRYYETA